MYGQQRNPVRIITIMVLLGIVAGIVYFVQDNPPPSAMPTPISSTPLPPTPVPALLPTPTMDIPDYRLFVPSLGIYASVIEIFRHNANWDISFLGSNAGHLEGTAPLDASGNIVLAGHVELADGKPGVFAEIGKLNHGDLVILQIPSGERRYQVTEIKTVEPDDLSILYPTDHDRLTLLTCSDYDFLQGGYLSRTIVVAERIA